MDKVTHCGDGLFQVRVPLPFPLRWVNAYVIQEAAGVTVMDPGLRTPEAEQAWVEVLEWIGAGWKQITRIVLTHHHPDHYGLAGLFQERSGGAPVWMSRTAFKQTETLWGERAEETTEALIRLFAGHGFPPDEQAAMRKHSNDFVARVSPQPKNIRFLEYGEQIMLGGRAYEILHTPGHAEGHISLLDRASGRMFCGDHVLPGITPNVGLLPFGDPNPLRTYLESLEAAAGWNVTEALPGHREPFAQYTARCAEIMEHHGERLRGMESMLGARAYTGYELCRAFFGERLSVHQFRFALSETIAHLVYLEAEGRIAGDSEGGGPVRYRAVNPS